MLRLSPLGTWIFVVVLSAVQCVSALDDNLQDAGMKTFGRVFQLQSELNASLPSADATLLNSEVHAPAAPPSTPDLGQSTLDQGQSTSDQVQSTSDQAQSTSDQAQSTSDQAQSTSDQAQSTSDQAQSTSDQAQSSPLDREPPLGATAQHPTETTSNPSTVVAILQPQEHLLEEALNITAPTRLRLNPLHPTAGAPHWCNALSGPDFFQALPRCPDFQPCHSARGQRTVVSACSAGFSDRNQLNWPTPPSNCHSWHSLSAEARQALIHSGEERPEDADEGWATFHLLRVRPELGCAHPEDFFPEEPVAFAVYRMENVYVSGEAVVFNGSAVFMRSGCQDGVHREMPEEFAAGSKVVKHVGAVVNWSYRQGVNFYHSLIECFPLFLSLASIMNANSSLPVLAGKNQLEMYRTLLEPLVGVPVDRLSRYEMEEDDLFFARVLYQPLFQRCGHLSKGLWTELRARHLLHSEGIPLFNADWSMRLTTPLTGSQMAEIPSDWVVVVAERPGMKRKVLGMTEIHQAVIDMFAERVVVFRGDLKIMQAMSLFRRARLFLAGHGAAMANMIFMPANTSVIEIRPDRFPNSCYHSLADACSLNYNLLLANGTGEGLVTANVTAVMNLVREVTRDFI